MKDIGDRINDLLEIKKISQKDLAINSGLSEVTICRYINHKRVPRADNLQSIAMALGVSVDYLIDGEVPQSYTELYDYIYKNAKSMTLKQRNDLIRLLLLD